MVVTGFGARVKAHPVCFEFAKPDKPTTKLLEVTVRLVPGTAPPPDGFCVDVDPESSAACKGSGFELPAGSFAMDASPGNGFKAQLPISASGPAANREVSARARIRVWRGAVPGPKRPAADPVAEPVILEVDLWRSTNRVLPLWQVLAEEYDHLGVAAGAAKRALEAEESGASDAAILQDVLAVAHASPDGIAALCVSGGGIRSATFGLGILQGLARLKLIGKFHYISSVSGGGYVSSWLSAWIHRAGGVEHVVADLARSGEHAGEPEPRQIRHLREYSNYLSPRTGVFSADTWTLVAIFIRNLLLNQLVLIPILAAALALPLLAAARLPKGWEPHPPTLFAASVALGLLAFYEMNAMRFGKRQQESAFLLGGLVPLLGSAALMVAAVGWAKGQFTWLEALLPCAVWAVAMPTLAHGLAGGISGRLGPRDLLVDMLSAAAAGLVVTAIYVALLVHGLPLVRAWPPPFYAWAAPILVLAPVLIGKTLYTAFVGIAEQLPGKFVRGSDRGDGEREWWARWSAWVLISLVGWAAAAGVAFYGPGLMQRLGDGTLRAIAYLSGGGLGLLTSLLGRNRQTPAREDEPAKTATWQTFALAIVAPLFCIVVALLIADATHVFLGQVHCWSGGDSCPPALTDLRLVDVALGIAVLGAVGGVMGVFVNVNRFSLQAMYRNRLVRAYLGASRGDRRLPNLFTGFDVKDNLRLPLLRGNRPMPVINMALNLVGGADLAWQERKATSFTATPLHCGSAPRDHTNGSAPGARRLGYRRNPPYGGEHGISLATAVATSGAAASPNMGQSSSPAVSFIMALFNTRLGVWLGNPGEAGRKTFARSGPTHSARPIFAEALGHTDDGNRWVNLSDGGHFDNLGLYEMVRRRCRLIVVSDAGCDPGGELSDLGGAIRKIRIDFGIPIRFEPPIDIATAQSPRHDGNRGAVATIDYGAVDGRDAKPGVLVYLKPTLCGDEPYDVFNYHKANPSFPHESTADQWFSESQFESYRALGELTVREVFGEARPDDLAAIVEWARSHVSRTRAPRRDDTNDGRSSVATVRSDGASQIDSPGDA